MKAVNRKYHFEYELIEPYEVGIQLTGAEVKSVKAGRIYLEDAFVKILESDEVFLINADIPVFEHSRAQGYDSRRTRKLLLHKKEILRLKTKVLAGGKLTIAPVMCYNKGSLIKVQIALSKGKRSYEQKSYKKTKDVQRQQERELREYKKV